jgi:hypothetical protein
MFLLAYAKEIKVDVEFSAPTHWIKLPRGYEGTRSVALKTLEPSLFRSDSHYVPPLNADPALAAHSLPYLRPAELSKPYFKIRVSKGPPAFMAPSKESFR